MDLLASLSWEPWEFHFLDTATGSTRSQEPAPSALPRSVVARGIGHYFDFYDDHERIHEALGYRTPGAVYLNHAGG